MYSLTEKELSASKYLFDQINGLPHSGGSFFGHLYNTFFILKTMGANEDTCLAGLYHSVYGTEKIYVNHHFSKEEVVQQIGVFAESAVKYFSMPNRDKLIFENKIGLDKNMQLCLAQILYANEIEQRGHKQDEKFISYINSIKKIINSLADEISKEVV